MCRHIRNAQVAVRAPCCRRWFECPDCHAEASDHDLLRLAEIVMACKKCKKVFRKDTSQGLDEADEYCPHCDNHYVIEAVEARPIIGFEGDDPRFFRDSRMQTNKGLLAEDLFDGKLE